MNVQVAATNHAQMALAVTIIKDVAMWVGLWWCYHLLNMRSYMLAWVASGNVEKWSIKWHDTLYDAACIFITLALWLDHYNAL